LSAGSSLGAQKRLIKRGERRAADHLRKGRRRHRHSHLDQRRNRKAVDRVAERDRNGGKDKQARPELFQPGDDAGGFFMRAGQPVDAVIVRRFEQRLPSGKVRRRGTAATRSETSTLAASGAHATSAPPD
jgi:hypothetical protein